MTNRSADIGASGVTSIMGGEQYRPYPAYKDSGVEWLGEIPAHWEVKASRREFTIQLGKMLQPTAIKVRRIPKSRISRPNMSSGRPFELLGCP